MQMTLKELADRLGGTLEGDGTATIRNVASLETARPDEVSFLANTRYEKHMSATQAGAVIVATNYTGEKPTGALIRCDDPYFAFREALVEFYGFRKPHFSGIDTKADIDPLATLAEDVSISAFATVAAGCEIGRGTTIYAGVHIGPNCRIGENCTLYPGVVLYDGTILHNRVIIHANSAIGQDGFGFATHKGDDDIVRHEKIPQTGWVELEDDVEIGACCAIERATMGPTIIGAGTKFADLIGIGHGTKMGQHCLMVSQSGISGSVMVGNYCIFAGQAGVVGHIRIGDGAKVLAQAGVTEDVPTGAEVLGSPAIPRPQARRAVLSMYKLPELRQQVAQLIRDVEAMKQRLDPTELD